VLCAGPHFDLVLTLGKMLFSEFWLRMIAA